MVPAVKILIVDDQPMIGEGLKQMLNFEKSFTVINFAKDGNECLDMIKHGEHPNVVLMDIKMSGMNGFEATKNIKKEFPEVKVIILTNYDDPKYVEQSIHAGAHGFLLKDVERADLISAIQDVANDREIMDYKIVKKVFLSIKNKRTVSLADEELSLTKRELEILECLAQGYSDKEIASSLYISEHTSRTHIRNIYHKMDVHSRSQAVAKAIRAGLIDFI
ncbi:MAG: response regulator transcription factor [Nisaea sp.]|jgi:DNA-binding NarL/FixJ family response regulator|nr:response regulator transcription factor [Nisaea sp.]|tara:strand:- start:2349 stop:3008 length:660 start_codon:yes stop_codon:yes gene_type:complete